MINYETILSSYDDKLTLMQWLKKVEAALAASVLTAVNVTQNGDVVTLSFDFEDGTKIETPAIRVNQQITGAQVVNGELVFTLSNGQTINAGNLLDGNPLIIPAVNVNFNGNATIEGFLTAEAGVSTPSLTCDGSQINAQKPVVEVMTGYAFQEATSTNFTTSPIYAGIVKNGNKLTLVYAVNVTRTASYVSTQHLAYFNVPQNIKGKLFPTAIGRYTALAYVKINGVDSSLNFVDLNILIEKSNATGIVLELQGDTFNNLPLNVPTYIRIEQTFLLSENLAA